MKRILLIITALALSISLSAQRFIPLSHDMSDIRKCINTTFKAGKLPPFSFVYGENSSDTFLKKWKFSINEEACELPGAVKYHAVWQEPGQGLRIDCQIVGYTDFPSIEWTLRFTNDGKDNSSRIKDLKALDCMFGGNPGSSATIFTLWGSNASRRDFQPREILLEDDLTQEFSPTTKASSDGDGFPFFNLHSSSSTGVMISIGWTGLWKAEYTHRNNGMTRARAGMKNMDLYLHAGESIRTPMISLLFYNSPDYLDGQNLFRQFILQHHTRRIGGEIAKAPLCAGFDWGDPSPCNEYTCLTETLALAILERYNMFGIVPDAFWLDAGWYCEKDENWAYDISDWKPAVSKFPRGLKPLSDAAHDMGSKLMVWFEPERMVPGGKLPMEHPDWYIYKDKDGKYLINLGNPEVCDGFCKYIGDIIEENCIDFYRQDFNFDPVPIWEANDEPGRVGITECHYIEGLYKYWDYLLKRFPQMQIDNCASGGRRLDIEMTSRSIPLWRTDYRYGETNGYQNHTYGLNLFLPLHGTGCYGADNYNFRSSLCSATVLNWELFTLKGDFRQMQKAVEKFRKYSPYYTKDYYPLSGLEDLTSDDVCLAYQLDDRESGAGIVLAFRRSGKAPAKLDVCLKGLDASGEYELYDDNDGSTRTVKGSVLTGGFEIEIPEGPGSVLLEYHRK